MSWFELRVDVPRGLADAAAARLFSLGSAGIQEDYRPGEAPPPRQPWDTGALPPQPARVLVKGWFEDPDRDQVRRTLLRGLGLNCSATWHDVPDTDWSESWKASFPVLHISDRLIIAPPWEDIPGAIVIEPGQGFGTGQHETTRAALRLLDTLPGDALGSSLDLGCGSGILAIAAARLGYAVTGVDIDPAAVADAQANAERNGVSAHFSTDAIEACPPADVVLANLHAELLVHYADDLARLTRRWLIVAGILADREQRVREALDPRLELDVRDVDGEWVSLRYRSTR